MYLSNREYRQIASKFPILCVDGIIVWKGQYLLVKRKNEPLKGEWWVPGGRVLKGESLEKAFRRKMFEEAGIRVRAVARIGFYEEVFEKTDIGQSKHTVSVVFVGTPTEEPEIKLDEQSSEYRWSSYLPKRFQKQVYKLI